MRELKRASPLTIAALFLLLAVIFSVPAVLIRDVYREWAGSHKSLYQYMEPRNSLTARFNGLVNHAGASLLGNSQPGLPQVRIYVSEQKIRGLQKNLPESVKNWKKGQMVFPDGTLNNVQIRHRGDNPFNWLYEKKSWRVKTSKEHMLDKVRSFNLIAPQDPVFIDTHFYLRLAQNCGLVAGDSRMVELVLNGETQGVHTEFSQLDENFLRNNRIMPVNLYKGEQRMSERRFGLEFDLFSGPALWSKDSVNNYTLDPAAKVPAKDVSDLDYILRIGQEALRDDASFERLREIVDWTYWARFAAYEILMQQSNDALHNNRLVADIWKGKVLPLPIDPQAVRIEKPEEVLLYQFGSRQGLLDRLERSSEFRTATIEQLRQLLRSGCLTNTIREMRALLPSLETSISRDPGVYLALGDRSYIGFDVADEVNRFLAGYEIVDRELRRRLAETGPAGWSAEPGKLAIASGSPGATGPWFARIAAGQSVPEDIEVWWDRNGDGAIGDGDIRLPATRTSAGIRIDAAFAGNLIRTGSVSQSRAENYGSTPTIVPALFRLLFNDQSLEVANLALDGAGGPTEVGPMLADAASPTGMNRPVFSPAAPQTVVYRGEVRIDGVRVETGPVKVEAGTRFLMADGASLILRGKTEMAGEPLRPISFQPLKPGGMWGVVGIQGESASGSVLRHVHMRGGSGARSGLTRLIAMLSIHDTSNILLDSLYLTENAVEDDMIHVIYADDVVIRNVHMAGARSDAIDSDISTLRIEGGLIEGSGNDAVDLMTSRAVIRNVRLVRNGDKGVSVGEGSDATIVDTEIRGNVIGVQSKDGSSTKIENSAFDGNGTQLSAYQKNWRYADGGRISARGANFTAPSGAGAFSADQKSQIDIGNSVLGGAASVSGAVIHNGQRMPQTSKEK